MRLILATLALALSIAIVPASAHPLVPGMTEKSPAAGKMISGAAGSALSTARRYIGTNPTKYRSLWCDRFVDMVEQKLGRAGTPQSAMARSYMGYGREVSLAAAEPGDIVVLRRGRNGRSGHVGYFVKRLPGGRVQLVSGNAGGGRVRESTYAENRILGVRRPI